MLAMKLASSNSARTIHLKLPSVAQVYEQHQVFGSSLTYDTIEPSRKRSDRPVGSFLTKRYNRAFSGGLWSASRAHNKS